MTMLIASMDHSPQEIPNDRDVCHTTALVLSEDAAQWGWNASLAPLISPQSKGFRKWTARNAGRYHREFRRQFPHFLSESNVYCLALSVQGGTIIDYLPQLIAQIGLENNLLLHGEEVTVVGLSSGAEFTIRVGQAAYVVYLLHFICRTHALVMESLVIGDLSITWSDWQISPDNFPEGVNGPMAKLFSIVANSASVFGWVRGNIRVSTNLKGDPGADVCDNLAGMLREDLERKVTTLALQERPALGGLYWEIHRRQ